MSSKKKKKRRSTAYRQAQKFEKEANALFAQRLRELRDEAGLTRAEVSAETGIPVETLCNYEYNVRRPPFGKACLFAWYFGVSLDYFSE